MSFSKAEYMLKYQKAKVKLLEYEVEHKDYPKFPLNYRDLAFPTVYVISEYAQAVIENNKALIDSYKDHLSMCAEFYDAALKSREQEIHDFDFVLMGAVAYFFHDDYGSSLVLVKEAQILDVPRDYRGVLANIFSIIFFGRRISDIQDDVIDLFESTFKENIDNGINEKLCDLREYSFRSDQETDLFWIENIFAVIKIVRVKSAYTLLPKYSKQDFDKWEDYFKKKNSIRMMWPSQILIGERGLLDGENAIVQLPTGVGKTKSIELIIQSMFLAGRGKIVLIVAPLRALCNEITGDMRRSFGKAASINQFSDVLEVDYVEVLGTSADNRILICTPEKLQFILHHQPDILSLIDLFIFDEGHMFDDASRGALYEFLMLNIKENLRATQQLVILSAVLSNAESIKQWIFGDKGVVAFDPHIRSTPKVVGFLTSKNEIHYYSDSFEEEDFYIPRAIRVSELKTRKGSKKKIFPERNAYDIALYYANLLCKKGGVALYVSQRRSASTVIKRLLEVEKKNYSFSNIMDCTDAEEVDKLEKFISEYYGNKAIFSLGAKAGIFPHYSTLPNGLRLSVEYAFRKGKIKVVVCTSTLAQGVNIPIKYMVMTSLKSASKMITTRNFQNLIGRTARSGVYTEGSVLISDPKLYDEKNDRKGSYRWKDTIALFDPNNAEACTSSILLLLKDIEIDYDIVFDGVQIINYIIENINDDWDKNLKRLLINNLDKEYDKRDYHIKSIKAKVDSYRKIIGTIENELCYEIGKRTVISIDNTQQVVDDSVVLAKQTLAYFLASENEKTVLEKLFSSLAKKIAEKSAFAKVMSKSMIDINVAESVSKLITEKELNTVFYSQDKLLSIIVEFYNSIYRDDFIDEAICVGWINGESFCSIEANTGAKTIDIEKQCGQSISFQLSFCIGNIIDYLADDGVNVQGMMDLQKKVKYGVSCETSISICEKVCNERLIANKVTEIIGADGISGNKIIPLIKSHYTMIEKALESYPSYFINKFAEMIK